MNRILNSTFSNHKLRWLTLCLVAVLAAFALSVADARGGRGGGGGGG